MNDSRYLIPRPLGNLLARLPAYPGSLLFVAALNALIRPHLPDDVRQALHGRRLRIAVRDASLCFDFEWRGGRFAACNFQSAADLSIGASAHDFLLLMQRREDPDTLFFSRRLLMEGDTDLGLLVKNTLDALDMPALQRQLPLPPWLRQWRQ